MQLPERVKIGPYNYRVIRTPGLLSDDKRGLNGCIKYAEGEIHLATDLSPDRELCTLLHECLHGIDDYMNACLDEQQIDSMANGLLVFLRDNGLLREEYCS